MKPEPVALDVDTGVDDALAILFAVRSPALELRAITCVAGNVGVDQVVRNTLTVLAAAGSLAVPAARGASVPLSGGTSGPAAERSVHGRDGLADLGLPQPPDTVAVSTAVDLLRRQLLAAPQPLTVVACGPLTNLAQLRQAAPSLLARARRLVVVGGSEAGDVGDPADFNLAYDLPAAEAVLGCGVPVTMYSLDVLYRVAISAEDAEDLAASADPGTRLAGLLARHQARRFGAGAASLGDAGAVLSLVQPGGLRTRPHPRWPAVSVAVDVDPLAYRALFLDTMRRGAGTQVD